jgi:hypothetical protein
VSAGVTVAALLVLALLGAWAFMELREIWKGR